MSDLIFAKTMITTKPKIEYIPKGSMCMSCYRQNLNCSSYPFSKMPVIYQSLGYFHVRCTFYERLND